MAMIDKEKLWTQNGKPIFIGLIQELHQYKNEDIKPIFTLREEKEGLISLQKLFVKYVAEDPTEVTFALTVFGSVDYWLMAKKMSGFQSHYEDLKLKADIARKSMAFRSIVAEVQTNGKSAFSAAKYLIEEPWTPKTGKVQQRKQEATKKAFDKVMSETSEDYARLKEAGHIN